MSSSGVLRIGPGIYTQTQTRAARIRLLREALTSDASDASEDASKASGARRIEVHAPLSVDGTYRGRLVFDVPRRIARAIGIPAPEPGDRFRGGYVHAFFDDEPLIREAAEAGLVFVARRGSWIVLEQREDGGDNVSPFEEVAKEDADTFAIEVARAARLLRSAEQLRLDETPEHAVSKMRERGRRMMIARGPIGRARLRRAIGWVDALLPPLLFRKMTAGKRGFPNCFRRTLVEIGLDRGAAEDTIVFGLDVGKTGHVTFKDAEDRTFDVAFEFPP